MYYASLLAWVGCVSDSHELAKWFGNDLWMRDESYRLDKAGLPLMRFMIGHLGAGSSPMHRLTMVGRFIAGGSREVASTMLSHCQAASLIAAGLGLDEVSGVLAQSFERWDGRGVPGSRAGDEIDPVMRVVQVADDAEVLARSGGIESAVDELRARRGTEFDPALVDLVCARPDRDPRRGRRVGGVGRGDRRGRRPGPGAHRGGAVHRAARRRRLRRSQVPELDRALARRRPAGRGRRRAARSAARRPCAGRACWAASTTSARSACRRASGTSGPPERERAGAGAHPPVPHRAGAHPLRATALDRRHRRAAPRAARRVGLSPRRRRRRASR